METVEIQKPEVNQKSGVVERLVAVTLEEGDYSAINATKQDLARVCSYLLEQYARGGVMIPAVKTRYLSDLTRVPIVSANDILEMVESVVNRKTPSGTLRVTADVDPAFVVPLESVSRARGRTIDTIVQDALGIVLTNSWIEEITPEGGTAYFTSEARQELEAMIGTTQLTGQSIVEWARSLSSKVVQRKEKTMVQVKDAK